MATVILKDASFVINSVDLSDHVNQIALDLGVEVQDDTAMGDNTRSGCGGLLTGAVEVSLFQDYASGKTDPTIAPIIGTVVAVVIKPASGSVSATNPSYGGNFLVTAYNPIAGSVGDKQLASVSLVPNKNDIARVVV